MTQSGSPFPQIMGVFGKAASPYDSIGFPVLKHPVSQQGQEDPEYFSDQSQKINSIFRKHSLGAGSGWMLICSP